MFDIFHGLSFLLNVYLIILLVKANSSVNRLESVIRVLEAINANTVYKLKGDDKILYDTHAS